MCYLAESLGRDAITIYWFNLYKGLAKSMEILAENDIYRQVLRVFFKPLIIIRCMPQEIEDLKDYRWERILSSKLSKCTLPCKGYADI